jgi:hypothetical protein
MDRKESNHTGVESTQDVAGFGFGRQGERTYDSTDNTEHYNMDNKNDWLAF